MEKKPFTRGTKSRRPFRPAARGALIDALESRVLMSANTATVSGIVYNDANGNGSQDNGEPGVANVTVYVDLTAAGAFASGDPTAVTNSTGNYTITNVPAGMYAVAEVVPPGYTQFSPGNNAGIPLTIATAQTVIGDNFGIQTVGTPPPASISGNIFNDVNGDGIENNGEAGLGGATVYLDASNAGTFQAGDPTRLTDPNGNYIFNALSAGTYTVGAILPVGESQTLPAAAANISVTLAAGQSATANNFGVTGVPTAPAGTIAGVVYSDNNSNGVQDAGEAGVSGLTVYVDLTDSGQYQSGDPMAVTDAQGNYTIDNLNSGPDIVRVSLPLGYTQTSPPNNDGISVTLGGSAGAGGEDFGVLFNSTPPVPATVTGTVFDDVNGDGLQDNGDAGIAGVTVYVDLRNFGVYLNGDPTANTNAQGGYTITGVPPGSYFLREIAPGADTQTTPANDAGIPIVVSPGQTLTGQNFGLNVPTPPAASISGTVFNDANHDGVQDDGETGVAGVIVYQDPNYNHKLDLGEQSVVTDSSGNFIFTDPPADPEILRIILPGGAQQTFPAGGIGDYVGKNTGQTLTGENFGIFTPVVSATGSITGSVFNDLNGDHAQTSGEPNLAGQTVFIDANNNGKLDPGEATAVSNSSGNFTFTGLAPGSYTIDVSPSAGFRQTFPVTGGTKVTVTANNTISAGKFGVTTTAYVGGELFDDLNGNGVQNTGETAISGWKVYIDLNNDGKFESNEPASVTNSVGFWYFRSVAPGTYTIRVVAPSGWTTTHAYTVTLTSGETVTNGLIGARKG